MLVRYVRVLQRPKASPKSDPVGHQAGKSQRIAVQVQRWSGGRTSSSSGDHSLYAVRPSTDWMKPTRIGKGICFTQSLPPEMSTRQKTTVAENKTKTKKHLHKTSRVRLEWTSELTSESQGHEKWSITCREMNHQRNRASAREGFVLCKAMKQAWGAWRVWRVG